MQLRRVGIEVAVLLGLAFSHAPRASGAESIVVGGDAGTDETLTIDSGSFSLGSVLVGIWGNGTFLHSGGDISASSEVMIGYSGEGTYVMSGASSLCSRVIFVKYSGTGAFIQNGGTVHADEELSISFRPMGAAGGYVLNDGTLITGTSYQRYFSGTFVGPYGTGTFVQNGGYHETTDLWLGVPGTGHATYTMTGGVLNVTNEQGGFGQFIQSGGTHTAPKGSVSGPVASMPGLFELSGGTYTVGSFRTERHGTFRQTGGMMTVLSEFNNNGTAILGGVESWAMGTRFINRGYATFASDTGDVSARNLSVTVASPSSGVAQADSIVTFLSSQHLASLDVADGGNRTTRLDLAPNGEGVVVTLALAVQGQLNVNDNSLIWDYATATPIVTVRTWIASARNASGVAWEGKGITSAMADEQTLGVGYAESSEVAPAGIWRGEPVDDSAILVTRASYGDADLDGRVDLDDLGRLATHWQSPGHWIDGDFDYNGLVDVNDLGLLASNWQTSSPPLHDALVAIGLPVGSVPEASAEIILAGAVVIVAHQRRREARRNALEKSRRHPPVGYDTAPSASSAACGRARSPCGLDGLVLDRRRSRRGGMGTGSLLEGIAVQLGRFKPVTRSLICTG
jgi:hypothetical protein